MITALPLKSLKLLSYRRDVPSVAVLFPFDPKMTDKQDMAVHLKQVMSKAEAAILQRYSSETAMELIQRLQQVMSRLNFNTHKKAVAIFLSSESEKLMYLDISLKEKIEVAGNLSMRDLVLDKNQQEEYLVLVLEEDHARIFDGNSQAIMKLILDQPNTILPQLDYGLSVVLASNPFPVFVLGAKKLLSEFSRVTSNAVEIVKYITSYKKTILEGSISKALDPFIRNWRKTYQFFLEQKLFNARNTNKLVCGLENVQMNSCRMGNALLLVDRDFYPSGRNPSRQEPFYIKDEVDRLIESTLTSGGNVELVDQELLRDYGRIALLQNHELPCLKINQRSTDEACFEI
ncbi:hypothetical protein ACFSQD_13125 [Flavihumibacter stibioxidans]|nr:hypothetical protein [Flavihumibacter stibioxidans]